MQDVTNRMTDNRTTLVVAHRLTTIKKADRIVVTDYGKIIEQGNHEQLMAEKGRYYGLNLFRESLYASQD